MKWKNRIIGHDLVNPKDIIPNPDNWRVHPVFQRESLNGVLDQVGWVQSVIVNKNTGNLVDGHLRVEEALNKNEQVPVVYVDLTEEEEKLILATIDPIGSLATINNHILSELLGDIESDNENINELIESMKEKKVEPLKSFKELDEDIPTSHECPSCGYQW